MSSSDEEQYNAVCDCDDCNVVLDRDTHIFIHMDKEQNEKVVCYWCYFDNDMWKTDTNTDNEICRKCGHENCEDDVHQCYKCDHYFCIDCDRNEMGTYDYEGEIHTLCYACSPKRRINFKVKKN